MSSDPGVQPRRLLHPRYWPSWCAVGLLSLGLLLPRPWRDALAARVGDLQFRRNERRRAIVEFNLACCFPEWSAERRAAVARDHFRVYARAMADQPISWWDRRGRWATRITRLHGLERLHAARAAGRPVILLCPHTAAVDLAGLGLALNVPLASMANRLEDPVLQWAVHQGRSRRAPVFLREQGLRPVMRALRNGRVFYYMPDEDLGPRNSVFVPFFGMEKATLTTLGRLARLSGAAVLPVMAWYEPGERRYQVELRAPLADFPSGDDRADAATMNRALEASIRRAPAHYLWNQRLFRSRPDGSRMAYPKRG